MPEPTVACAKYLTFRLLNYVLLLVMRSTSNVRDCITFESKELASLTTSLTTASLTTVKKGFVKKKSSNMPTPMREDNSARAYMCRPRDLSRWGKLPP